MAKVIISKGKSKTVLTGEAADKYIAENKKKPEQKLSKRTDK